MNPDLLALLIVQEADAAILDLETRLAALTPRPLALAAAGRGVSDDLARTEAMLARELERHRDLEAGLAHRRALHERSVEMLHQAQTLKEATAAAAQVEATRRTLADEEREVLTLTRRIGDLRTAVTAHREAVTTMAAEQATARADLAAERASLEAALRAARAQRARSSRDVSPGLLARYDRIHDRRRTTVLVPLHPDYTCGACDTAIPLQRRPALASGTVVEPCEECGVLLYRRPPTVG